MLEIDKKDSNQAIITYQSTIQSMEIALRRKFNNESLMFIQFLKRKLKINAKFVFMHNRTGLVLVSKQPVKAKNSWMEFVNSYPSYASYNLIFHKDQDSWDLKDFFKILLPQVAIHKISIEEKRTKIYIAKNQMKYAIGKERRNEILMDAFLKQCSDLPSIEFVPDENVNQR